MYAEKAQLTAMSCNAFFDGSMACAVALAESANCANDGPQKCSTEAAVRFSQQLLADAALHRNSPRSSALAFEKLRLRPGDPFNWCGGLLPLLAC